MIESLKLTPVESSHVAAIGYLEDQSVLLIAYKDGSLYARPGWTPDAYDLLMRSPSIGKALHACAGAGPAILITKGTKPTRVGA
jgi:hypothetical protein